MWSNVCSYYLFIVVILIFIIVAHLLSISSVESHLFFSLIYSDTVVESNFMIQDKM